MEYIYIYVLWVSRFESLFFWRFGIVNIYNMNISVLCSTAHKGCQPIAMIVMVLTWIPWGNAFGFGFVLPCSTYGTS
jgi:hypothetical protein